MSARVLRRRMEEASERRSISGWSYGSSSAKKAAGYRRNTVPGTWKGWVGLGRKARTDKAKAERTKKIATGGLGGGL